MIVDLLRRGAGSDPAAHGSGTVDGVTGDEPADPGAFAQALPSGRGTR